MIFKKPNQLRIKKRGRAHQCASMRSINYDQVINGRFCTDQLKTQIAHATTPRTLDVYKIFTHVNDRIDITEATYRGSAYVYS